MIRGSNFGQKHGHLEAFFATSSTVACNHNNTGILSRAMSSYLVTNSVCYVKASLNFKTLTLLM